MPTTFVFQPRRMGIARQFLHWLTPTIGLSRVSKHLAGKRALVTVEKNRLTIDGEKIPWSRHLAGRLYRHGNDLIGLEESNQQDLSATFRSVINRREITSTARKIGRFGMVVQDEGFEEGGLREIHDIWIAVVEGRMPVSWGKWLKTVPAETIRSWHWGLERRRLKKATENRVRGIVQDIEAGRVGFDLLLEYAAGRLEGVSRRVEVVARNRIATEHVEMFLQLRRMPKILRVRQDSGYPMWIFCQHQEGCPRQAGVGVCWGEVRDTVDIRVRDDRELVCHLFGKLGDIPDGQDAEAPLSSLEQFSNEPFIGEPPLIRRWMDVRRVPTWNEIKRSVFSSTPE